MHARIRKGRRHEVVVANTIARTITRAELDTVVARQLSSIKIEDPSLSLRGAPGMAVSAAIAIHC